MAIYQKGAQLLLSSTYGWTLHSHVAVYGILSNLGFAYWYGPAGLPALPQRWCRHGQTFEVLAYLKQPNLKNRYIILHLSSNLTCSQPPHHTAFHILGSQTLPIRDMVLVSGIRGRFVALALCLFLFVSFLLYQAPFGQLSTIRRDAQQQSKPDAAVLTGHAIAPKLGNATAKYVSIRIKGIALCRARRSTNSQTGQNSVAQPGKSYIQPLLAFQKSLQTRKRKHFGHTYTCSKDYIPGTFTPPTPQLRLARADDLRSGECAEHFGQVLAKYPPQVSSRTAAAMWGCFVHNVVNKRLKKPEFDCKGIGDAYDCGCGDEKQGASGKETPA